MRRAIKLVRPVIRGRVIPPGHRAGRHRQCPEFFLNKMSSLRPQIAVKLTPPPLRYGGGLPLPAARWPWPILLPTVSADALKVGAFIMLIRHINSRKGLLNRAHLVIKNLNPHFLDAKILTGNNRGERVFIPRIDLEASLRSACTTVSSQLYSPLRWQLIVARSVFRPHWGIPAGAYLCPWSIICCPIKSQENEIFA